MRMNRILVVEDEALVGFEIMAVLRKAGIEPLGPFPTVSRALAAIDARTFEAALLDSNLHGVPSFDVAEALKRKAIPFAFVTAYGHIPLPVELRSAPLLGKPYQEQRLLSVARALLGMPQALH